ncbi:metabolite traffic protein EboE [Zeaxanthinibacter sp. PT1]|uniref:metabolite traffic protein EboE n=1 Tax=Zeaxanthinibacter TaxID=561554 RepID=UPI0023496349|nr:metabolite traffic protein EboE [Zeaxanthinibacter sp. PT1]MDC6352055.1 metabolite traffic protein EboE [Zeaxanthinibacter sp. PT1]
MLHKDYHLTYCTNIHPGQDWETTYSSLKTYLPGIKQQLVPDGEFGVGLRLSNKASEELDESGRLQEFGQWLSDNGLYVFTMNGFPYGNFHHERVKDQVHSPDWTTPERVQYTKRLFRQLSCLIPQGMEGGISTSPISYKHWFSTDAQRREAMGIAAEAFADIALFLYEEEEETGNYLHLDIEPEPDGLLENSEDVLSFYNNYLDRIAGPFMEKKAGINGEKAREILRRYITLCYDVCHFSLAYEDPAYSFKKFRDVGIRIGKIQVSAALKIIKGSRTAGEIWKSLKGFNEPVYLHQVTERKEDEVVTYPDLPAVLDQLADFSELRAHFHVPIFLEEFGLLHSTQDQILEVLRYLRENRVTNHLEIETYTWEVLPDALKIPLADSIIRELQWLKEKM